MIKRFLCLLILILCALPCYALNNILIIGDSLSAGYGIDKQYGWVALLSQRLGQQKYNYKTINASISGDTTSDGLARLPNALKTYQPDITIIELGGNDGLRGIALNVIKNNLSKMITLAKHQHSKVLLLGIRLPPNYGATYTTEFQGLFSTLAQQQNITLVPLFLNNIDNTPTLMQPDGIHPTQDAQPQMLENVWPALQQLLIH